MRQFSKTSSGNERGLHVQIMKKLDDLNLKSPKAQKNMNWMGLVDDALGIDDLDDDQPYNPQGLKDTQIHKKLYFFIDIPVSRY